MSEQKLNDILTVLKELLKWSKFQGLQTLKEIIRQLLETDEEKMIYEQSDGHKSARDVAELVGISKTTVTNYWKKWSKVGIVVESEKYPGRMKRIVSLDEIGIGIPQRSLKIANKEESDNE